MKYYAGIDPSFSGTAVVILNEEFEIVEEFKISTKKMKDITTEEKINYILKELIEKINKYDRSEIIFNEEDISFGSTGQGSIQQGALNYSIRCLFLNYEFKYLTTPPTTLKKFVTGSGNSPKDIMLKEVYKKWKVDYNDDDLCDAYSLARYSFSLINKS